MSDYYTREHEQYRKQQNEGSMAYFFVALGVFATLVPVAVIAIGSAKAYKKIKGVFKK